MVRAVVIGCGRMGAEQRTGFPRGWNPVSHAQALKCAGAELVGLCDVDEERLKKHSRNYRVRGFCDYRAMLKELKPDLVTVATRTPEKSEIVLEAAEVAKAVYVEKPLANSLGEARSLLKAAGGISLGYGVNRRYHASYRLAKELISQGEIGVVQEIVAEFGISQLLWTHPHTADLFVFFAESTSIEHVQAEVSKDPDPIVYRAEVQFSSGIFGIVSRGTGCNVRICGTKGTIIVHADGSLVEVAKGNGYHLERRIIQPKGEGATVTAIKELIAGYPIKPGEIETGMAILMGWALGKKTRLEDIPEDFVVTGESDHGYA